MVSIYSINENIINSFKHKPTMDFQHFSLGDYIGLFDHRHLFRIDYHQLANSLEEEIVREFRLPDRIADHKFGQIRSTSAGDYDYCSHLLDFAKKRYDQRAILRKNFPAP
ncbi:MAG TPA: hypothetical protein VJG49_03085 [Candidatus Nanoarchaeia archaeon]|nr:hypothetical protein [Candidatus Nanoarchaeia archaeon]